MKKFFPLLMIIFFTGCSVYNNIYSTSDKTANFSLYKTFAWLPDKDSTNTPFNNQIIRNTTVNYFTHCMGERGMKANIDSPDVLMQLEIKSIHKEETVTTPSYLPNIRPYSNYAIPYYHSNPYYYPYPNSYYYYAPYYYNYYSYSRTYTSQKVEYTQSTITLNIIDRKLNRLVWMGVAEGDLYDPAYIDENLHPAVYDILNDYPVKPIYEHKRSRN